ncbi:hypothetical protein ACKI1J_15110 [Streptomyces scabiei]|uniref:hypothetical protein n=1 Tax=Streptomyces scabiei TaxID=1930 RepID=UPI0038F71D11
MADLIVTLTVLAFTGAALTIAVRTIIHKLREANQLIDDIFDQPGEENPQP